MENEKKNIKKILIIIAIVILLIIATLIIINMYQNSQDERLENQLRKDGYTRVTDKIYEKAESSDNDSASYVVNIATKRITKTISRQTNDSQEVISLLKNGDIITASYNYRGPSCRISQTGSYNGKDFTCDISNKKPGCEAKCDVILTEIKKFAKEKLQ